MSRDLCFHNPGVHGLNRLCPAIEDVAPEYALRRARYQFFAPMNSSMVRRAITWA